MSQNSSSPSTTKTALVTGASGGIGLAIARELSADHALILGCSSETSAASLREEFPDAKVWVADLQDVAGIADSVAALVNDANPLSVLVHSAGVIGHKTIADASPEFWQEVLDVNVRAVAELTRAALPALRAGKGIVVAVNSGAGINAGPGYGPYAASKFALTGLADSLREEERGLVRVTSIHPGKVDTAMQEVLQEMAGNDTYDGAVYVDPVQIAKATRLAVDATPETSMDMISVRPVVR